MSSTKVVPAPPVIGTMRGLPEETPGLPTLQDEARATALRIHHEKSLPFLESLIGNKKKNDRIRLDAAKLIQQQALPPPQPVMGDVNVTIVVDM